MRVLGDPGRFRQVWLNLLSNAVKCTRTGSITVRLAAQALPAADVEHSSSTALLLLGSVTDTGIGMSDELLHRLFRPFSQAESTSHGGTGLGLAITKSLVELLGGTIGVSSHLGVGSTFSFSVRVEPTPDLPGNSDVVVGVAGAHTAASRSCVVDRLHGRILVVEDDLVSKRLMTAMLSKLGCVVDTAGNGLEAVHAWQGGTVYDAILMDWEMPLCDGLQATKEIRRLEAAAQQQAAAAPSAFAGTGGTSGATALQPGSAGAHARPAHTRIVGMSAHALEGARRTMMDCGMDDVISKPIRKHDLYMVLAPWLAVRD